jgi:hypothetical protein
VEDEQAAEARAAWWTHSYVWRDPPRATFLLYVPDEDGHDLVFLAWGADAEDLVSRLRHRLQALGRA